MALSEAADRVVVREEAEAVARRRMPFRRWARDIGAKAKTKGKGKATAKPAP